MCEANVNRGRASLDLVPRQQPRNELGGLLPPVCEANKLSLGTSQPVKMGFSYRDVTCNVSTARNLFLGNDARNLDSLSLTTFG